MTREYHLDTEETVTAALIPYNQNYYGALVNGKAVLLVNRTEVNRILHETEKYLN